MPWNNKEPMALVRRNGILVWVPWNEPSKPKLPQVELIVENTQEQSKQQEETEEE